MVAKFSVRGLFYSSIVAASAIYAAVAAQAEEPNRGGAIDLAAQDAKVALERFQLQEGFEINLFASEKDFPMGNPVAMNFDSKGRLWVSTMPTYPQYLPGNPPQDKILILEDTDNDGSADKHTVFADGLHLPTGFELGDGGVYVGLQPDLAFLKDTDGDDKADTKEILLHGLGTEDSHHAVHCFQWGPGGELYFGEGTFHHSQVETPYGPVRLADAGFFRYEPKSQKFEVFVSYPFANPWGHVFDYWGQNFIADASGGSNYFGLPITGHVDHPRKHPNMKEFTTKVRPTCGCEIVWSRHFPESSQGNFLVNNCIGFQGIKQHQIIEEDSGFTSKELEPLLFSTDPNFRPVDIEFGPDGALYIVDWFNPLIGHMQYSLRDENRDSSHGRVWRITYKHKPLLEKPKIAGQSIAGLLELLKTYEHRTRYRARMDLRLHDKADVVAELKKWVAGLDKNDPNYEHNLLEALWAYQTVYAVEPDLLRTLLTTKDYRARAAATRVLRYWRDKIDNPLQLFQQQVNDEHPRVRLEAVVALSHFKAAEAAEIALQSLRHPTDYYLNYGLTETMATLEPYWKSAIAQGKSFAADNPAGADYILGSVRTSELVRMARSLPVYVALLTRQGVLEQYRLEAVRELAKANNTDELTELLTAIDRLDRSDASDTEHVLNDLARMLTSRNSTELTAARERVEKLAASANRPITRQIAYVTLITADGSVDATWAKASQSIKSLNDLIDAVPLIPAASLRTAMYEKVEPLLHGLPPTLAQSAKGGGTKGRYVRIELPGGSRTLTLAEVQVFSDGVNIAPTGKANQSSTSHGGEAKRAIDGNTSGRFADGGQTHSRENDLHPWWELDLGSERPIEGISIWNRTENDGGYAGRLNAFRLIVMDSNRQPIYTRSDIPAPSESARFDLERDAKSSIRRSAINAVTYIPGHEPETFRTLAGFVDDGEVRDAAVRAIRRIPKAYWPREAARPLAASLLAYVEKVPTADRTSPAALNAIQLGNDVANLLPPAQAKDVKAALGELGVNIVLVRPVPHKMAFDRTKIFVEAGKPVEIVLENADIMPHNLLITAPGAMVEVGEMAEQMATQPDAFAKHFVPDTPKVLHATKLLQPRQTDRLQFNAPKQTGEYPFVCTFPGHWRTMYGTLHVVEDLDQVPPEDLVDEVALVDVRPFVRDWTLDELLPLADAPPVGRSFKRGKELFTAASCAACHKVKDTGGIIGPDLTDVAKRFKRPELLREIIEPSKLINEKYQTMLVQTSDGDVVSGVVVERTNDSIKLMANPLEKCEPREVKLDDIEGQKTSPVSLMPQGLLVTLNEDEILDLMAYLESGGDPEHALFKQ